MKIYYRIESIYSANIFPEIPFDIGRSIIELKV